MLSYRTLRTLTVTAALALAASAGGCVGDDTGSASDDVTDVNHTDVERQSIGNCWLYAQASWLESLNLTATGEAFDISQSYWTYWHWYGEITDSWGSMDEISTGGNQWTSNGIVLDRGIMGELDFVPEDATGEMSNRQSTALNKINGELKSGRLSTREARQDGKLVRDVLDEAWGLSGEVVAELDQVFGEDGAGSLRYGASADGTAVVPAADFPVQYTRRNGDEVEVVKTNAIQATEEWKVVTYPTYGSSLDSKRRDFQIRVQRALHDAQPVVITWDVDFNAMENGQNELQGSFNLTTLAESGGPGHQGGHMTVLEDYEVETEEFGILKAGVTLDPNDPSEAAMLDAALLPTSKIRFMRIKNSWGSLRPDREFAPGFPGYHDLYMDYLNGPIDWCPSVDSPNETNCTGTTVPLNDVMLPPGY